MTAVAGAPVVGVDGSQRSLDAVEAAAAEAVLRHRPLRIVHAFRWPALGTAVTPGVSEPSLQAFLGGVAGLLLGSVSQHLIHHAACPTAVARPVPSDAP